MYSQDLMENLDSFGHVLRFKVSEDFSLGRDKAAMVWTMQKGLVVLLKHFSGALAPTSDI